MHLRRLSLTNFRNYARQDFEFGRGTVLLLGANAQGKTNVLEAIFLLATGRSERSDSDADYIAWAVRDETQPYARIEGTAVRGGGETSVDLTIVGREGAHGLIASKRLKLNGVAKRASDALGAITAVLFTTDDMELVKGAPSGRRRYLDVMLSQVDRGYVRALSSYNKVITQRNALLKKIGEGSAKRDELAYWDEELVRDGATILSVRAKVVAQLSVAASDAHGRLSGEREQLVLAYQPRGGDDWPAERIAAADVADVAAGLIARLQATQAREIGAGLTLSGPHRDDLSMTLAGVSAASFASRGQQRTAALALRLAESRLLHERSGERPILLLDDVLSELDGSRRASVLAAIDADQVIITSADADRFAAMLAGAEVWDVAAGGALRR